MKASLCYLLWKIKGGENFVNLKKVLMVGSGGLTVGQAGESSSGL